MGVPSVFSVTQSRPPENGGTKIPRKNGCYMDKSVLYCFGFASVSFFKRRDIIREGAMNRTRCPWCGQKIVRRLDCGVEKKKTPRYFRFARCHYCGHDYGQHAYSSKLMRFAFFSFLPVVILSFVFQFYPLLFIYAIILTFSVFLVPLIRMTEEEEPTEPSEALAFQAVIIDKKRAVKTSRFYFLAKDFDERAPLSAVSPVCFRSFDKRSGTAAGYFLYQHPQNAEYQNPSLPMLYDESGRCVGKIRFRPTKSNQDKKTAHEY